MLHFSKKGKPIALFSVEIEEYLQCFILAKKGKPVALFSVQIGEYLKCFILAKKVSL